jgi:hypothetical protein
MTNFLDYSSYIFLKIKLKNKIALNLQTISPLKKKVKIFCTHKQQRVLTLISYKTKYTDNNNSKL